MFGGLTGMMTMIATLARGFERNTNFFDEGIVLDGDSSNTGTTQLAHESGDTICLELVGRTHARFGDRVFIEFDGYCTKEAVDVYMRSFNNHSCYVVNRIYTQDMGDCWLMQVQLKVTNPSEEAVAISLIEDLAEHVVDPYC